MCFHRSYSKARFMFMKSHYDQLGIRKKFFEKEMPQPDTYPQIRTAVNIPAKGAPADVAIVNAKIHGHPDADSVLLKGNQIMFIGKNSVAEEYIRKSTRIIDAKQGYVLPGFCDSHVHLTIGAEYYQGCDVDKVGSYSELSQKITEFASEHPELQALHAYGLHYLTPPIIPAENARQVLDKIVPDRPLFIYAHDLHTGWANTKALEEAGIMQKMPPFPEIIEQLDLSGNIELDDKGFPTGELREPEAYFLVEGALRTKFPLSAEQKLDYLRETCNYLAALGVTSVHNMGLALPEEDIELLILLLELEERGELPVRVASSFSVVSDENMFTDIDTAARIRDALRDAREGLLPLGDLHKMLTDELHEASQLRHQSCVYAGERHPEIDKVSHVHHRNSEQLLSMVHGIHVKPHLERLAKRIKQTENKALSKSGKVELHAVKIFMDGVIEKNTAYRSDVPPLAGIPAFCHDELMAAAIRADRLGLQVSAHSIGDASVSAVLDAVKKSRSLHENEDKKRGHRIRHRIEHIELCAPEDIDRFCREEVIPSMQALHERPPVTLWHQKVPESKWATAFPWQSLLQTGAHLTFGSDWPIVSCNCLEGLHRAVTREPWKPGLPNQGLTFEQGLSAFTTGNAYAGYQEQVRGKLIPGMLADLVVIAGKLDYDAPDPEKLKCVCTICDGGVTYSEL